MCDTWKEGFVSVDLTSTDKQMEKSESDMQIIIFDFTKGK